MDCEICHKPPEKCKCSEEDTKHFHLVGTSTPAFVL